MITSGGAREKKNDKDNKEKWNASLSACIESVSNIDDAQFGLKNSHAHMGDIIIQLPWCLETFPFDPWIHIKIEQKKSAVAVDCVKDALEIDG